VVILWLEKIKVDALVIPWMQTEVSRGSKFAMMWHVDPELLMHTVRSALHVFDADGAYGYTLSMPVESEIHVFQLSAEIEDDLLRYMDFLRLGRQDEAAEILSSYDMLEMLHVFDPIAIHSTRKRIALCFEKLSPMMGGQILVWVEVAPRDYVADPMPIEYVLDLATLALRNEVPS
jgi:hypothetical protein